MESGINKIKVVWICHFTNDYIQEKLKIRKTVAENAPWITLGIEEAKKRDDIELHIVSPHRWISKNREFDESNVFYHFFNPGIPIYGRHWPRFFRFDIFTNFFFNKKKIKKFVNKIKPDIIHLHGLENAYYSSSIFQFRFNYPVLITIQGFNVVNKISKGLAFNKDLATELEIMKNFDNYGVRYDTMKEIILKFNDKARFYWHEYFYNAKTENINIQRNNKVYDMVFFGRVYKGKGVEDVIVATGLLKKEFPEIKTAIIGGASEDYLRKLKKLATTYNVVKNIEFFGFFPRQEDIYKVLNVSKIAVLPSYFDTIPGTMIESMHRKIPVVSYNVGGIPDINRNNEIVLLSESGDINGLVNNIKRLLVDERFRLKQGEEGFTYAKKRWNNEKALDDIIEAYKDILTKN